MSAYRDCCVVNVAIGSWYPAGQARLHSSLKATGYDGALHLLGSLPQGAPAHADSPYSFKTFAMREASQRYRYLLWLDASMTVRRSPEPLFGRIRDQGYLLLHGAYRAGEWMSDEMLRASGRDRAYFMARPNVVSGCVGVDTGSKQGRSLLEAWHALSISGVFRGAWDNRDQCVSHDPRVRGHRHDQSALDVVAADLGLVSEDRRGYFSLPEEHVADQMLLLLRG